MSQSECPLSPNGEHEMCTGDHLMPEGYVCGVCNYCLKYMIDDDSE